ncbi:hypothetical protein PMAYCL1PPCAC_26540, partial [Pristionchus mayeri]
SSEYGMPFSTSVLITSIFGLFTVIDAQTTTACNVYNELEASTQCGSSGYALQFGFPNCINFSNKEGLFNAQGKAWLECVRSCLSNFVQTEIIAKNITDCATIKSLAFDSHVPCYVNCGFCNFKFLLFNAIPLALTLRISDLLTAEVIQQAITVIGTCLLHPRLILG